jgi:hypothetical protein
MDAKGKERGRCGRFMAVKRPDMNSRGLTLAAKGIDLSGNASDFEFIHLETHYG